MLSIATETPALRAAGLIGVWNTNVVAGKSVLDVGAATLLAGNASLAGTPLPMEAALSTIHPDDRAWVFERIRRVRQTGGPFSAEFRILTGNGCVRWILNRGTLTPDATGAMRGLGAYIDTTDSHGRLGLTAAPEQTGGDPLILTAAPEQTGGDPLILAADHCIEAHIALKAGPHKDLRLRMEQLLTGIGQAIARRRD